MFEAFKSFLPLSITFNSSYYASVVKQEKDHDEKKNQSEQQKETSSSIYIVEGSKNIFLPLSQTLQFFTKISFCYRRQLLLCKLRRLVSKRVQYKFTVKVMRTTAHFVSPTFLPA